MLQTVDVDNNGLTGYLPPQIANLTHVQSLALAQNGLQGPLPNDWAGLTKLESLNLSRNNLTGSVPQAWTSSGLPSLQNMCAGLGSGPRSEAHADTNATQKLDG